LAFSLRRRRHCRNEFST